MSNEMDYDADRPISLPELKPLPTAPTRSSLSPIDRLPAPVVPVVRPDRAQAAWLVAGVLGVLLMFFIVLQIRSLIRGGGRIDSDFNIDGVAVLVLEDDKAKPRREWSEGQVSTLMDIQKWAEQNVTELDGMPAYRNLDVRQDFGDLDPFWDKLKDKATIKPPVVLVVSGRKLTEFAVPSDSKAAIKALESAK